MCPVSPLHFAMITEYYPKAEENHDDSMVFFRETVIFRDLRERTVGWRPASRGP
jgi:hypothetical protein